MLSTQQQLTLMINRLERALCYMQTSFTVTDRYIIELTTQKLSAARAELLAVQTSSSSDRSE
jgi:hypothetical protein